MNIERALNRVIEKCEYKTQSPENITRHIAVKHIEFIKKRMNGNNNTISVITPKASIISVCVRAPFWRPSAKIWRPLFPFCGITPPKGGGGHTNIL